MSELSHLSPKEKAQTGIILIKAAIEEVLAENKDRWLRRNQIEDFLGLWSEYGSGTYGAVASMFLDELVKEGDAVSRRDPDGRTWLYRTVKAEISNLNPPNHSF